VRPALVLGGEGALDVGDELRLLSRCRGGHAEAGDERLELTA
jgi:hypothetical protein